MTELSRLNYKADLSESDPRSLAQWQASVAHAFPPLDISPIGGRPFSGSIRSAGAGDLYVSRLSSSPHVIRRTPTRTHSSNAAYLKLSVHLSGSSVMTQDGREIVLNPGDITLYDTSRPYTLLQEQDFSMLVAMFPREAVRAVAPDAPALAGLKLDQGSGLAAMFSTYLKTLEQNLDTFVSPAGVRLARAGLELIGALLATELDEVQVEEPQTVTLRRIQNYVDKNLGDPDLTPSKIAADHFISVRHLHSLFQAEGASVAAWIRTQRLERCRRDLSDPMLFERNVASIAAQWGFFDPGYFAKLFRSAYGCKPTEYRAAALGHG